MDLFGSSTSAIRVERERILVTPDGLLAAVTDRAPGGTTVEGRSPPHGATKLLDVEVRRNEAVGA